MCVCEMAGGGERESVCVRWREVEREPIPGVCAYSSVLCGKLELV